MQAHSLCAGAPQLVHNPKGHKKLTEECRDPNLRNAGGRRKTKLLVANRGEIARRVIRSAKSLDISTVVVFTHTDALSLHVKDGDEAVCLGANPREYTNAQKLVDIAKSCKYGPDSNRSLQSVVLVVCKSFRSACSVHIATHNALHTKRLCPRHFPGLKAMLQSISTWQTSACRCDAVHPGYGFLSENADFVEMLEAAGIAFLGPKPDTMRLFSRKHDARAFAHEADVPILAGAGTCSGIE